MTSHIEPRFQHASLTRRRFVTTACLGLAAGLTAKEGGTAPRDRVALAYERYVALGDQFLGLADLPGNENFDTPKMLRISAERSDLEAFITTTPPATTEGACAKLRWVASEIDEGLG